MDFQNRPERIAHRNPWIKESSGPKDFKVTRDQMTANIQRVSFLTTPVEHHKFEGEPITKLESALSWKPRVPSGTVVDYSFTDAKRT
eukprot:4248470-Pyramimonas_sp.AAC.1